MTKKRISLIFLVIITILCLSPLALNKWADWKIKNYLKKEKNISSSELIILEKTFLNFTGNEYMMTFTTKSDKEMDNTDPLVSKNETGRDYFIRYNLKHHDFSYYPVYNGNTPEDINFIKNEFAFPPSNKELKAIGYDIPKP